MQLFQTIFVALLTSNAAAFKLPVNTTDGSYVAYFTAEGVEVHQPLSEYVPSGATDFVTIGKNTLSGMKIKRQFVEIARHHCGCGFNLNHGDCDGAVNALKSQFNAQPGRYGQIDPGMAWYSIRGSVVAFACNEENSNVPFRFDDPNFTDSLRGITNSCGWYVAGTRRYVGLSGFPEPFPSAWLNTGYMIYYPGHDFCGASTISPADHC